MIHPVPYHAQGASAELVPAIIRREISAAEDPLWRAYGADSPEEYAWWSWRLCGIACLRMALDHWRDEAEGGMAPTAMALAEERLRAGGYRQTAHRCAIRAPEARGGIPGGPPHRAYPRRSVPAFTLPAPPVPR
ncbi:hypothetical protein [Streptomyces sp. NPDC014733]|uniref:hypothetical protein n=1 Tax=Streptomyces sp. NPDC014733 TaxID=3364885 RepID=UPI0036F6822C